MSDDLISPQQQPPNHRSRLTPRDIGNILLAVILSVALVSGVAYIGHIERTEIAMEQDANHHETLTALVQLRYIVDCLHVSPSRHQGGEEGTQPERRSLLLVCAAEARTLTWQDNFRVDLILSRNLELRETT